MYLYLVMMLDTYVVSEVQRMDGYNKIPGTILAALYVVQLQVVPFSVKRSNPPMYTTALHAPSALSQTLQSNLQRWKWTGEAFNNGKRQHLHYLATRNEKRRTKCAQHSPKALRTLSIVCRLAQSTVKVRSGAVVPNLGL